MKKDLTLAAIVFLAISVVCYGLAAALPPLAPPPRSEGIAPAKTEQSGRVVMRVNGEPVTEHEFNALLVQAPEQMQLLYATPEGRRMLAEDLVKLKALEQEGVRLGLDRDPEIATSLEMNRTNILARSALRKMIGSPSEDRLRAEYEKEKQKFEATELSHILIAYQGGGVPARSGQALTEAQAMQKAQAIVQQLGRGADFGNVARAESDDVQSAVAGGAIGTVPPGSLPPELEAATSGLTAGAVSRPVKSEFGIHIFKAGDRRTQPFEAVRDALEARVQREEADAAMTRLKNAAKVELDPKFFPEPKHRQQ